MAIEVDPRFSPRLIAVPESDGTSITMQELHDQAQDWSDEPQNASYQLLLRSFGKQALGGGTLVGITVEMLNSRLAFRARTQHVSEGIVTTANPEGELLIDSGAAFETDGVQPGASVINFTDKSVGTVLNVDSETQLRVIWNEDGTDNQFDLNDEYKVWNIIQVTATGGNLTGLDSDGNELNPIFPTFGTQVILEKSSSATLTGVDSLVKKQKFWKEIIF